MFDNKVISILSIILLLAIGCKDSPIQVEATTPNLNTLNNPDLGVGKPLNNYWYHLNDEEIEAHFIYYNVRITRGANTINSPDLINLYLDTLNFRTFPYYTIQVDGKPDTTISYMLGLTAANIDSFDTFYPLDETNTSNKDWCNKILVEYEGNCPETVEVSFDYQLSASSTSGQVVDTLSNPAVYKDIPSKKEATFSVAWTNIDSLVWDNQNKRYDVITDATSNVMKATLCAGNCNTSSTDPSYVIKKLKNFSDPNAMFEVEEDKFDSLIYVGIIDTDRYNVNSLMLIDRTEWDRHDSIYYNSTSQTLSLDTIFTFQQIKVPESTPMFWINTDCNQNLKRDPAEFYADYGADWCPDSLETGDDIFTDLDGDGKWDENEEELVIDWNNDNIWTPGLCAVVDTDIEGEDGYGEIFDEVPCNCLGDWRETVGGVENPNYNGPVVNDNWVVGSSLDPNGDNWRDCGWDGKCFGDDDYSNPDPNGTENNGKWDRNEGFEENDPPLYNYDILTGTGDYFDDMGNGFPDEPAEFCVTGADGICDGNDPFEDRNCNEKWDDEESGDEGNGIWDDEEAFFDKDNDGSWNNGDGNWRDAEPLYILSDRMETFIVDYSNPSNPVPVTDIDNHSSVTLMYGTYGPTSTVDDSVHLVFNNFISTIEIQHSLSESFYDIDSIVTKYTNKIIESPLPGDTDDYHIAKSRWYQEENDSPSYGYDYHLFKNSGSEYDIIKMTHPAYFNYYGYYTTHDQIKENFWETILAEEETYIYTYDGNLRDGEYYYQDTTIITDVADYYIQNLYEGFYDPSVKVPFKQVRYEESDTGEIECIVATDDVIIDPPFNCPPADTLLTDTYKITRTKTMTMIGSGLEFGLRNTLWLGSAGPGDPLGIVKDQLEIRWSEPYWKEFGVGWNIISRLELSSLRKTKQELSRLMNIFQPIKNLSLNKLVNEEKFDYEPYVVNSSYGIHTLGLPNEK